MDVGYPRGTDAPRLAEDARRGPSLLDQSLRQAQRLLTRKSKLEHRGPDGFEGVLYLCNASEQLFARGLAMASAGVL